MWNIFKLVINNVGGVNEWQDPHHVAAPSIALITSIMMCMIVTVKGQRACVVGRSTGSRQQRAERLLARVWWDAERAFYSTNDNSHGGFKFAMIHERLTRLGAVAASWKKR